MRQLRPRPHFFTAHLLMHAGFLRCTEGDGEAVSLLAHEGCYTQKHHIKALTGKRPTQSLPFNSPSFCRICPWRTSPCGSWYVS
jgi:hypothetical protein